jgi:hypothetical protein
MSTDYTPIGVIRDELRQQLREEFAANPSGLYAEALNLQGSHYNPLVSTKDDHSRWCECDQGGDVDWESAHVRNGRLAPRLEFAWAGGAA